jgi:hypothetical protein
MNESIEKQNSIKNIKKQKRIEKKEELKESPF